MRFSLAFPLAFAILAVPAATAASADALEQREIILFGANWCVPCIEELRDLPELAKAASPDRLVIAWTDGVPRIPGGLGVERLPREKSRELLARYGSGNAGLPLTVMIGKDGARCAMLRRRLTGGGIAGLRKECDAA